MAEVSLKLAAALWLVPALLCGQQYFPSGVFGSDPQSDSFKANWYSKHLKAMHEPSLWDLSRRDSHAEAFRFLWLRSSHHPIVIRLVVRPSGSGWLDSRMTSGTRGFTPGGIRRYSHSWLRKSQTQALIAEFENAGFWNMPTLAGSDSTVVGVDGARWIMEGVRNGQYHVVDRWSPGVQDPLRAIGVLALKLARFRIRPAEIY